MLLQKQSLKFKENLAVRPFKQILLWSRMCYNTDLGPIWIRIEKAPIMRIRDPEPLVMMKITKLYSTEQLWKAILRSQN